MSTHKYIDRICCIVLAVTLAITVLFMCGESLGITSTARAMGYETKLFDTSKVHTINIVIDDWDGFLETCTNEEYTSCSVVIDNEAYKNVAIRAKGNTSLTQVKSYGNNRYSFKIEFDHYDSTKTYYGLDKLCLNNIIQDNTYMKDYLCYRMMSEFGVDSPLCSYVYITVNGEDWGLYLAVEGIEDSFLQRNYGNDTGELYKPDSQSMGGGRGNGDNFKMSEFNAEQNNRSDTGADGEQNTANGQTPQGTPPSKPSNDSGNTQTASGKANTEADSTQSATGRQMSQGDAPEKPDNEPGANGGGMGAINGSDDVSLIYSDDEYSSYRNIFENAKTDISDSDKDRLIASLKKLNNNEDISAVVDVEEVIRYFVVHNFVCNFDSYTGSMIHNYYLYEKSGQMSMIPWDYNLAFGGFRGVQNASALVNYPIDTPVSGGTVDSRPMLAWIFADDEYTQQYHELFSEFIEKYFDSDYIPKLIESTKEMIAEYVEKDPTKFCDYEEFESGVIALEELCTLRAESISGQLNGTIPSTSDGQTADSSSLIKADDLSISDMGTMNNSGGTAQKNSAQSQSENESANSTGNESFSINFPNNTENASDGTGNSEKSDSFVPTGDFGEAPPDMPNSDRSEPPSMPNGEMPSKADDTQDNSAKQNTGEQNEKASLQGGEADGEKTQTLDKYSVIILATSAGVLIIGVAAAFFYKKKS